MAKQPTSPSADAAPKLLEVNASVSLNGKVQVKKFDINSGYHFGLSERYDVSALSEDETIAFEEEVLTKLYERIDPYAQTEFDKLWAYRVGEDDDE